MAAGDHEREAHGPGLHHVAPAGSQLEMARVRDCRLQMCEIVEIAARVRDARVRDEGVRDAALRISDSGVSGRQGSRS